MGRKQALLELVEELDVHEVWVGCCNHYGWSYSSSTTCLNPGEGLGDLENTNPKAELVSSCSHCSPYGLQGMDMGLAGPVCAALGESEPHIALRRELQVSFWPPPRRGIRSPRLPHIHAGSGSGMRVQGGEQPPRGREKLPPCSSCFSPSPVANAGKGRARPRSRLRPSAAWPWASERESELDTITSMSNTGALPHRAGQCAGSTGMG